MYISKQHFKNMAGKNNRIKVVYVGWGSFIKKKTKIIMTDFQIGSLFLYFIYNN